MDTVRIEINKTEKNSILFKYENNNFNISLSFSSCSKSSQQMQIQQLSIYYFIQEQTASFFLFA